MATIKTRTGAVFSIITALWLTAVGCNEAPESDPAPPASGPLTLVDALDVLLVIDNSGSMATEQMRLSAELDRFIRILSLGDRAPELPAEKDRSNTLRYFNPVKSLHLGIVTTNVGGIDDPFGDGEAINACRHLGDAGKLQNGTMVAQAGVTANTSLRQEFESYAPGEVVLPADPSCAIEPGPRYLEFVPAAAVNAEEVITRFRCTARVGVRGCAFEQPFEAMMRALPPPADAQGHWSYPPGARNHLNIERGHLYNAGFLRENALLAVLHISDEDDCSINFGAGKQLFDNTPNSEAEMMFGKKINLRCGLFGHDPKLTWPVEHYAEYLRALKPGHPERVLFSAIVGVPQDAAGLSHDDLLARPDMNFVEEGDSGLWRPSCVRTDPMNPARPDKAIPPRRFVQLAKLLGERASLHSICADNYGPVLASLIDRVAPLMAP